MSTTICLVFPHQLFSQHPALAQADAFWLIEDELFFTQLPFHQKKLALHRASMNYYAEYLRSKGKQVRYFEEKEAELEVIFGQLRQLTTQPYFSGSNYLKKQGFKTDAAGAALFDALFWHFVDKHQERLRKNMRTVQMVANWNRMLPEKKAAHLERAAMYFQEENEAIRF